MKIHAITVLTITAFAFAAGCARQDSADETGEDTVAGTAGIDAAEAAAAREAELQKSLPPPDITPVTITVNLSPAAKAAFAANGESILLDAVYGGDPTQAGQSRTNEMGVVELGRVKREVGDGQPVTLAEDVINKSLLAMTIGQPQLMVNVTSGRKTTQDNLLACDFYWETLAVAGAGGVTIPCKLLSEVAN